MKKLISLLSAFAIGLMIFAQKTDVVSVLPAAKVETSGKTSSCAPKSRITWENSDFFGKSFFVNIPDGFTCFGFAWKTNDKIKTNGIKIKFSLQTDEGWTDLCETEGYVYPKETPTQMFWSELNFTPSQTGAVSIKFEIINQRNTLVAINKFVADFYMIESEAAVIPTQPVNFKSCPYRPYVIPRSVWLDPYYTQPPYTSTIINSTHVVVHHGASPDTYTDGAAVVRSYWNYHVNSNGWADIGYNYLFDKYGNTYQGRQNSSPLTQDVRGAHAGASNDYSIGVNFLGNADVTLPTTVQLDTLKQFLAWWFDWRSFDPTTSANLVLQSGGSAVVPRILGHKDTNIGGTTCPGNTLYSYLSSIRTGTKAIIDACSGSTGPQNLAAAPLGCPDNNVQFTWQNSGTGWWIEVSASPSFTNTYIKWVSGLTTYTGPSGFVLQSDGVTPLAFAYSTAYYWRIWNGSYYTNGSPFTTFNCDDVLPVTAISTPNIWKTADFIASFSDSDNIAVEKAFYQVLDFDGTYWGANPSRGFFGDNFDILQPSWANYSGVWNISAGELVQTDEANGNTNIYAALEQTLSNRYLYHFTAKAGGTGINKRFGFHFFCDNAALPNRGNSYFVWFRIDDQSLQFYKVENDVFSLVNTVSGIVTNTGQLYDYKVTYDRISGVIAVWRNNVFLGSWTDTAPYLTSGNHISFRTGNCTINVNEIKVYRSRYPSLTVTLDGPGKDIRYQNPDPSTYGAKIKSIVVDVNNNLSGIAYHDLNVDWTQPSSVNVIDGLVTDVDTVSDITTISSEWTASADPNSGIAGYWYALGSTPGQDDIVQWANNGLNTNVTLNNPAITYGNYYYFSVKSKNNADLWSDAASSDGFLAWAQNMPAAGFYVYEDTVYLPTANALFFNTSTNASSYLWDFGDGQFSTAANPWHTYTQEGIYTVSLVAMENGLPDDTMLIQDCVYVLNPQNIPFNALNNVNVFPNPFKNEIGIKFNYPFTGNISLIDGAGRTVRYSENENVTFYTFNNLGLLNNGIYFLVFSHNDTSVIVKLSK